MQRTDQRSPTRIELECYNKVLKLSEHILSVSKPKDQNVNTKHIPKRNLVLGRKMMDDAAELGADILEANEIYVGLNLDPEQRLENYKERIKLQDHAKRMTYRIEHIFRILHLDRPFAESTSGYMMDLLCESRKLIIAWRESDMKSAKQLMK